MNDRNQSKNEYYSDTLFNNLFRDKENFVELYNAISGNSINADKDTIVDVTRNTDKCFHQKNEIAMKINGRLVVIIRSLHERASQNCIRFLNYMDLVFRNQLSNYLKGTIEIPEFYAIVVDNKRPKKNETVRMSERYWGSEEPTIDIAFKAIYISHPDNVNMLEKSKLLFGYQKLISKISDSYCLMLCVEENKDSIIDAVKWTYDNGYLKDYLEDKETVVDMLCDEAWDTACHEIWCEEAYEEGRKKILETFPKVCRMIKDKKSDTDIVSELDINKEDLEYYKRLYKALCEI